MTVFLAHAPADRQTAEALEKIIERRGQFCELDDGQTALRPVGNGDAFVVAGLAGADVRDRAFAPRTARARCLGARAARGRLLDRAQELIEQAEARITGSRIIRAKMESAETVGVTTR